MRHPTLAALLAGGGLVLVGVTAAPAGAATPLVLRVGTYKGIPGTPGISSIQDAVNQAHAGDWVLVGPGVYHETGSTDPARPAGVLIDNARGDHTGMHLRGMDRNAVVVDGSSTSLGSQPAGSAACSSDAAQQNDGPAVDPNDASQGHTGRNGVEVFKVNGVTVENLTVCNFLTGDQNGKNGNEIWFNGGDGSGSIGMDAFYGAYLTASSTFSGGQNGFNDPRGEYGIFSSNADGPGVFIHDYASNMGDAAYYVGACQQICNTTLEDVTAENSALGFSGTNAGGTLVIQNSTFDNNKSGIVSNSQNNDDKPSPQIGLCPGASFLDGKSGPLQNGICTDFRNNHVFNNNNPNVPGAGSGLAGSAPTGSGFVLAGDQYSEITGNTVTNNGSWGVLIVDLPDQETPPPGQNCQGGIPDFSFASGPFSGQPILCYFQAFGNVVANNAFAGNGQFGNPTNGDIAFLTTLHNPGNCAFGNTDSSGTVTTDPPGMQTSPGPYNPCGSPNAGDTSVGVIEALCATALFLPCPSNTPGATYPASTQAQLAAIPHQPTMPDPCAGVPVNPWCPAPVAASTATGGVQALANTGAGAGVAGGGAVVLATLALGVGVGRRRRARTG